MALEKAPEVPTLTSIPTLMAPVTPRTVAVPVPAEVELENAAHATVVIPLFPLQQLLSPPPQLVLLRAPAVPVAENPDLVGTPLLQLLRNRGRTREFGAPLAYLTFRKLTPRSRSWLMFRMKVPWILSGTPPAPTASAHILELQE